MMADPHPNHLTQSFREPVGSRGILKDPRAELTRGPVDQVNHRNRFQSRSMMSPMEM